MSEDEFEDCGYQRVVLLDPPPTAQSLTVTLADGSSFRPMDRLRASVWLRRSMAPGKVA